MKNIYIHIFLFNNIIICTKINLKNLNKNGMTENLRNGWFDKRERESEICFDDKLYFSDIRSDMNLLTVL